MDKPPICYTENRYIPAAIRKYVDWRDNGECVTPDCDCREGLEYDHVPCWNTYHKGERRHDPDRIFLRCKVHHKKKSALDISESAKSKRIGQKHRGEKRPSRHKIVNRSFDKNGPKRKILSRGFEKRR